MPSPGSVGALEGTLRLVPGTELALYDAISQEYNNTAGTEIVFYHFDQENSGTDPLYQEPTSRVYKTYKIIGFITYPNSTVSTGESGMEIEWSCQAVIPRKNFEDVGAPVPTEGSIVSLWDIPFYKDFKIPGSGYFFSIVQVNDTDHIFDGPEFLTYTLILRRHSQYVPERFIETETPT